MENAHGAAYIAPMPMPLHAVTTMALALDPADRLRLAAELVESVEAPEDKEWSAAWFAEIRARRERGAADAVPWSEARAGISRRLYSL